jgi:hypothetical protein
MLAAIANMAASRPSGGYGPLKTPADRRKDATSMNKLMAFGRLNARPRDGRTSVSAIADDGVLVVALRSECWKQALQGSQPGEPVVVRQKLTEWAEAETGRVELREDLERAAREQLLVRAALAYVTASEASGRAADSSAVFNFSTKERHLGTVTHLEGDDVEIAFEEVKGGNAAYREAFAAFGAIPMHSRKAPCAQNADGQLIVCFWDHWLSGAPGSRVLSFTGELRAWFPVEGADERLRQALRKAFETGSTIRLVVAQAWASPQSHAPRTVQGFDVVRRFEPCVSYMGHVMAMRERQADIVFTRMGNAT